jgi:excisionase family DNA binding protein
MSEAMKNPFDAILDAFRAIVREELKAAMVANQAKPKLTYDTKEAAAILYLPESWIAAAARDGKIACVKVGHYVRFRLEDLQAFIESEREAGARQKITNLKAASGGEL